MNRHLSRRFLILLVVSVTGMAVRCVVWGQESVPALATLKATAENGDATAQDKLADTYRSLQDEPNALIWYRKAAKQGVANSQSHLGRILIGYARDRNAKLPDRIAHAEEAIQWLQRAAQQGEKRAQVALAREFQTGTFIEEDLIEAYAWYALVAKNGNPKDPLTLKAVSARDALILRLTKEQVAEGQKRLMAYAAGPKPKPEMPEPTWVSQIKLQGLSGAEPKRLAIINGLTFEEGEEATIKLGVKAVKIRCLDIKEASALVSIAGLEGDRELRLALR